MDTNKLTNLEQLRNAMMEARNLSSEVAGTAAGAIQKVAADKQDKITVNNTMTLQENELGVKTPVVGVTQAEYDALPEENKKNSLFIITDAGGGGAAVTKEYVDSLVGDIGTILDSINGEVV